MGETQAGDKHGNTQSHFTPAWNSVLTWPLEAVQDISAQLG